MSDWIALGLVAAALYFVECIAWVDGAAMVCARPPFRRGWRGWSAATLPGNDRGGLVMTDPANLDGALVICHYWPISLSPDGLTNLALDGPLTSAGELRFVGFDELRSVRAEFGELYVNEARVARVSSSALASHLADRIREVWQCTEAGRPAAITAAVAATLDDRGAAAEWQAFRDRIRPVHVHSVILFAFTFGFAPLVLVTLGPYPSWAYLLVGLVALTITNAVASFHVHAALYPGSRYDRWVHALSLVLLPVAAMRGVDRLSRDVLFRYSAAVVSPLLCTAVDATPLLRQQFLDLKTRFDNAGRELSAPALACATWFQQLVLAETEATLRRLQVPVSKPPAREDDTMQAYCPRCHGQFMRTATDGCPECAGMPLVAFARRRSADRGKRAKRRRG